MPDPDVALIIISYGDEATILPAFVFLDERDVETWLRSRDDRS